MASGTLKASPQTVDAIATGRPLAILVGGYDGSGNYGDIAQLDAALGLLGRFDSDLLALPVVEQRFAASHETAAAGLIHPAMHALYFAGSDEGDGEGLVPVWPPEAPLAISYLYGG